MERYIPVAQTQPKPQHVIVLVSRIQKTGTRANNFVKWRGTFRSDRPKWPDRSKWTTFKPGHEYSGQTKPKWTIPFDQRTKICRKLSWMEIKHPWTPLSGGYWGLPRDYTQLIYPTTFSCFCWNFVTLLTNLTNEQAQKQLKTKILVEFKPG